MQRHTAQEGKSGVQENFFEQSTKSRFVAFKKKKLVGTSFSSDGKADQSARL